MLYGIPTYWVLVGVVVGLLRTVQVIVQFYDVSIKDNISMNDCHPNFMQHTICCWIIEDNASEGGIM